MSRIILTLIAGLAVAVAAVVAASYSGLVNIKADTEDAAVLEWLLHNTYEQSLARAAETIQQPEVLDDDARVLAGAGAFQSMCAGCHTPPGLEPTPTSQGLNPPPPDLGTIAVQRTPEESFWVIKNGVRMTGMGAFGQTHDDAELWELTAFIERMQGASAGDYRELMERSNATASADDGHDHRHAGDPVESGDTSEQAGGHAHAPGTGDHNHAEQSAPDHAHDEKASDADVPEEHHGSDNHGPPGHHEDKPPATMVEDPQARVAEELHTALIRGDETAVRQLLAEDVLIYESGGKESSMEEYAGHHMPSDMAFLQAIEREVLSRTTFMEAPLAAVATRSRLAGEYQGQSINTVSTETLLLKQQDDGSWKIAHVHWSSN